MLPQPTGSHPRTITSRTAHSSTPLPHATPPHPPRLRDARPLSRPNLLVSAGSSGAGRAVLTCWPSLAVLGLCLHPPLTHCSSAAHCFRPEPPRLGSTTFVCDWDIRIPRQLWLCRSSFPVQNVCTTTLVNESHTRSSLSILFAAWSQPRSTRSPLGPLRSAPDIFIIESLGRKVWLIAWLIRLSRSGTRTGPLNCGTRHSSSER